MPPTLTSEAVQALAPDPASLKAGQKLANPASWPTLARDGDVLWGEAKGSGAHPYLVAADLRSADIATKCSCPSRKFPCKHALGLLLLHAAGIGTWQGAAVPEELNKWLEGRQTRAEKAAAPSVEKKEADPAQQAKTWAKREKKMSAGLEALELWLADLVREGLLAARGRGYGEWDGQAARMVDAQLPGVARLIRQIPELLHEESGEGLTVHLGRLHLLTQAWNNRDRLSKGERADLLSALGLPLDKAALTRSETDDWLCVGSTTEEEGRLTVRRTWLLGLSGGSGGGEVALLLDFAPQNQPLGASYAPLQKLTGALGYAPSAFPQRAVLEGALDGGFGSLPARSFALSDLAQHWAQALAKNPWLERLGVLLGPVYFSENQLCDMNGRAVPLSGTVRSDGVWHFRALADTEPAYVFGEWDGLAFLPLTVTPHSRAAPALT